MRKLISCGLCSAYCMCMEFEKSKTLPGLIYVPQRKPGRQQKHGCPDCFSCQMCGEERCKLCRPGKMKPKGKPALPEGDNQ